MVGHSHFRRDRLFKTDEVHAQSVIEAVLLDVRTGIVVHTASVSENISAQKTPADLNFDETVARAQADARGKAMMSLAKSLNERLVSSAK